MSQGGRLAFFFALSLALHGVGLWAAAGRIEPRAKQPGAEVAILDRDLFFRHAPRAERQVSQPVSAADRIAAWPGSPARPDLAGETLEPALAAAPPKAEPEDGSQLRVQTHAAARVEPSSLQSTAPPRRDAVAPVPAGEAERAGRLEVSGGVAAATPPRALPETGLSADVALAEPARASEIAAIPRPDAAPAVPAQPMAPVADVTLAEPARAFGSAASPRLDAAPAVPAQPMAPVADVALAEPARATESAASPRPDAAPPVPAQPMAPVADVALAEPARATESAVSPRIDAAPAVSAQPMAPVADVALAEPARASEGAASRPRPDAAPAVPAQPMAPVADVALAEPARATESAASPRLDAALPRPAQPMAQSSSSPMPALERRVAETAQRVDSPDSGLHQPASIMASAGDTAHVPLEPSQAARPVVPVPDVAPTRPPGDPQRFAALATLPVLRGTLPAPFVVPVEAEDLRIASDRPPVLRGALPAMLVATLDAQRPMTVGTPVSRRSPGDAGRLPAAEPSEAVQARPPATALPTQAAPPAERSATRTPQPTPAAVASLAPSLPLASAPAAIPTALPREVAVVAPAAAALRPINPADQFTRTYRGGECFFPVRIASEDGERILGYGLSAASVLDFARAFAQIVGADPDLNWRPITDAQCTGISFTRHVLGESAPSVAITLEAKEIASGEYLTGRVSNSKVDFLTLLLVDDDGQVHNVLDYLRTAPGEIEFSVPVHPVADGADRVQLIMAIGASMPLPALESTAVVHSDDFFPELLRQVRETGAKMEIGLEDFVITGAPPGLDH